MSSSEELWDTRNVYDVVKDYYLIKIVADNMANLNQEVTVLKAKMLFDRGLVLDLLNCF